MTLTAMALGWLCVVLAGFGIIAGLIEFAVQLRYLVKDIVDVLRTPQ